ncbi:ParB/RepB/Spo0J family partition protein [Hazenella sp. IB182357]|uniref:ParB/RepB/Spo0J family partition protein n=1 Tax=Polycladospora coralii TaxID=2771432 RepID=A0A926RWY1_9BACL|nr:ParB/RepB/Spo0J family partition protein [Polycladospora coralii]MBD1371986.1 ParB/RepB/Spo0J family partition protein [Polycladospora coralii]
MSSKRLGRGLDALLSPSESEDHKLAEEVALEDLRPNPYQPRKFFNEDALTELKQSIGKHGIVQPIVVRKSIHGFEIVAGERRYRAAKLVGLSTVPIVIKEINDDQMMEMALIENLQREDLNPIEIANAYQKLMKHFSVTQEEVAEKVGKSRPHVTNFIRLLQLPESIQEDVSRGTLSMGHARALIGVKDRDLQRKLAQKVINEQASVRELEEWIKKLNRSNRENQKKSKGTTPEFKRYEDLLQQVFQAPVRIRQGKKKGKIEIEYFSERELDRLIELLNHERVIDF